MFEPMKYAIALAGLIGAAALAAPAPNGQPAVYTLERAVSTALDNNPSLQMMHERIALAEAQWGEAQAGFYPQIQTRLSYEHTDNPSRAFGMIISQRRLDLNGMDFNQPGGTDNYRPEIVASYTLYNGGRDTQNSKAAELGVTTAALNESAARNQLIEWVSTAFYRVLAAQESRQIAERSIAAVQSELQQTRQRFDAGTALKADVLSLQVQLAEAEDDALQAANAVALAESGLKTLLGSDSPLSVAASGAVQLPQQRVSYAALLEQALARRPEIRVAQTDIEIAEHKLKAAKGAYLPKADAYVSYGSDSKDLAYSTRRDNVTAGVTVSVELFSGFASSERVKQAESALAIAQLNARQIRLALEDELKAAQLQLHNALDRLAVTESSVAAAEEALRLVKAQRVAGTGTVTRYIEAEVARDQAQSRVVATRYDALRAQVRLNKALGLWSKESL